jgi:hypothetical protein
MVGLGCLHADIYEKFQEEIRNHRFLMIHGRIHRWSLF